MSVSKEKDCLQIRLSFSKENMADPKVNLFDSMRGEQSSEGSMHRKKFEVQSEDDSPMRKKMIKSPSKAECLKRAEMIVAESQRLDEMLH